MTNRKDWTVYGRVYSIVHEYPKRSILPIPKLNSHGLLPTGIHDCTVHEIDSELAWNSHRKGLLKDFKSWLAAEIRPMFPDPIIFDGSFVTDKEIPDDIDVVLDLRYAPDARKLQGLQLQANEQPRFRSNYRVHFFVNLPGVLNNDFCAFFQYLGLKTAKFKGLDPKDLKGVLRLT